MGNFNKVPTMKTVVFGTSRESPDEKRVLTARAKRRERVERYLETANDEDKKQFIKSLFNLDAMLSHYATESERLLVFIDNNVIQDILKRDQAEEPIRGARFHAFLALLILAEDHYLIDIFACISPAVMYEASGRGTRHIDEACDEVFDAITETGLVMHTIGFSHPNELKIIFKKIQKDEKKIRAALDEIKIKSWKRNFSLKNGLGTRIPFSLAEEECPNLSLDYFPHKHVKFLLMHMIEKRMFSENSDQTQARKLMKDPQDKSFSILKPKGDGVEGLGDIELLAHCNLREQTLMRTPHITMGLTFDDSLRDALTENASVQSIITVLGGVDDPSESTARFAYEMMNYQRRTVKANKRMSEYRTAFKEFVNSLFRPIPEETKLSKN